MAGGLRRMLVLSIWEDVWSLGEGGGVPDELIFMRALGERGVTVHQLIPEPAGGISGRGGPGLVYHSYPNIFRRTGALPKKARRLLLPYIYTGAVRERLRALARESAPDLLLGFSHYSIEPVSLVARELGIPSAVKLFGVMFLGRSDLPRGHRWWLNFDQQRALRHPVDRYIVLNDGTMGDRALAANGVPPEKISFLPNGMEMSWAALPVDRAAQRLAFGLPAERVLICTVSRLVPIKRIEHILEAAARIGAPARDRIAVVIGGDGPERPRLEALARRLGIGGDTYFLGALPYERIPLLLKSCDIFAATSDLTNMSMPPCEAMICGLPVAAFDAAGTAETVREGETGLLVPYGDIDGLARALERLAGDERLRGELGRGAARFAAGHFMSWDDRIAAEIELLEALARRPPPAISPH
ncbi:MAG: glycosyltransferase family 4 protein [Candidatus Krumholzibacteria bacterium]|nr:glycosyltransferase family 4 protein [Candidatus Krumholzibacteria bacterium]